jgi:hypothetical protein
MQMKKTLVTAVAVISILVTMATAHAAYISTFNGSADYTLTWGGSDPIELKFTNPSVVSIDPHFPPAGVYNWSMGLSNFTVDLFGNGPGIDFGPLEFGPIDIGTYAVPPLSAPGSANLGDVTIPFSIFGQGLDSLALNNLKVEWFMPFNDINFAISANDMTGLEGYLEQMNV